MMQIGHRKEFLKLLNKTKNKQTNKQMHWAILKVVTAAN